MRNTIFSLILTSAVLATAAFTAHPAAAQTTLHVPFTFTVAGRTCPAGNYVVQTGNFASVVTLDGPAGKMLWPAFPGKANPNSEHVVLTFDKSGQNYTLRTVQYNAKITKPLDKPSPESIPAVVEAH